ncbi:MAG TPA: carbohydrate kinase [Candidatus Acidoferrales bacterium]|jgi:fructokinase|nr:carbohydrate kinase [Candidatus Acidoferrales bacterium]
MPTKYTIVGLGELLWDVFPNRKELGGAPANFAYMVSLLGDEGLVASRVGRDRLGNAAARRLAKLGLSQEWLQLDTKSPTGTVKVQVFEDGQPKFQIAENVAWDNFEWTSQWQALAARTAAVCFGSLAQRSERSRKTIRLFLENLRPNAVKVFDVNLRQSFFSADILRDSAKIADIMKVNQDELPQVAQLLGYKANAKEAAGPWLLQTCGLKLVCVTEGPSGSSLVAADGVHRHPGFPTQVADTVGAGDAFTAALIHHYLRGATLDEMNEAANRMGSWVASQVGATPKPDVKFLKSVLHSSVQQLD